MTPTSPIFVTSWIIAALATPDLKFESSATTMVSSSAPAPALAAVTVKLPSFWTINLEAWFQHAKAQVALWGVTSPETRCFHVVSALDAPTAVHMAPFLTTFRTPHDYNEHKMLLLETLGLSDDERARSFNAMTKLGDRCPLEVMDQLHLLHGREEPNFLLRQAFKRLLPPAVHYALAAFPATNSGPGCGKPIDLWSIMKNDTAAWAPSPACLPADIPLPLIEASPVLAVAASSNHWCRRLPLPLA